MQKFEWNCDAIATFNFVLGYWLMKKFLRIIVLGLLWSNIGFAACIEGDCVNGQGTSTSEDGHKYVGEYKDGMANGQGTLTYANGINYSGE